MSVRSPRMLVVARQALRDTSLMVKQASVIGSSMEVAKEMATTSDLSRSVRVNALST